MGRGDRSASGGAMRLASLPVGGPSCWSGRTLIAKVDECRPRPTSLSARIVGPCGPAGHVGHAGGGQDGRPGQQGNPGHGRPPGYRTGPARRPVLPVDSEHSAIFQALQGGPPGRGRSGGADSQRRTLPRPAARRTVPRHRRGSPGPPHLGHGPKITIDSATLMNKALEIIEARWLFDLEPDRSRSGSTRSRFVHSLVEIH